MTTDTAEIVKCSFSARFQPILKNFRALGGQYGLRMELDGYQVLCMVSDSHDLIIIVFSYNFQNIRDILVVCHPGMITTGQKSLTNALEKRILRCCDAGR